MEKVSLSAVLPSFTLCWYFDQTMEKFSLPVGLQSRTFVYGFDQSSDMVTLPVTLPVGVVVQTHLRPRLTVGSINCYGSEGPVHSVFAINVAVLTAARLRTALRLAGGHQAGAFAMQEIRHPENGFRWGGKIAATEGWRVQWSAATSVDHHGVRRQGGTALLWRRELARGAPCRFDAPEHLQSRACGRAWESFWVWSVYGDALKVDFERMGAIQRSAFACPRDRSNGIIVGDFNWKRPTTPRSGTSGPSCRGRKRSRREVPPRRDACTGAQHFGHFAQPGGGLLHAGRAMAVCSGVSPPPVQPC